MFRKPGSKRKRKSTSKSKPSTAKGIIKASKDEGAFIGELLKGVDYLEKLIKEQENVDD